MFTQFTEINTENAPYGTHKEVWTVEMKEVKNCPENVCIFEST
jgi:hypothetical protein